MTSYQHKDNKNKKLTKISNYSNTLFNYLSECLPTMVNNKFHERLKNIEICTGAFSLNVLPEYIATSDYAIISCKLKEFSIDDDFYICFMLNEVDTHTPDLDLIINIPSAASIIYTGIGYFITTKPCGQILTKDFFISTLNKEKAKDFCIGLYTSYMNLTEQFYIPDIKLHNVFVDINDNGDFVFTFHGLFKCSTTENIKQTDPVKEFLTMMSTIENIGYDNLRLINTLMRINNNYSNDKLIFEHMITFFEFMFNLDVNAARTYIRSININHETVKKKHVNTRNIKKKDNRKWVALKL